MTALRPKQIGGIFTDGFTMTVDFFPPVLKFCSAIVLQTLTLTLKPQIYYAFRCQQLAVDMMELSVLTSRPCAFYTAKVQIQTETVPLGEIIRRTCKWLVGRSLKSQSAALTEQ